ncbi:hypothetical protein ABIE18_001288 [Arthrobacter sp. 2762]
MCRTSAFGLESSYYEFKFSEAGWNQGWDVFEELNPTD